ncbi:MAG: GGDEF domain-containing protein, partial [Cloacibacillus sp.]
MLVADLDGLKIINDNLGHTSGDAAIKLFADTLATHFADSGIVGRIGGDEFMAFLDGVEAGASLDDAMKSLIMKLVELHVYGSIGVVTGDVGADCFNELYRKADMALYHVKRNGKCDYAVYSPQMEDASYKHTAHERHAPVQRNIFERNHQDRLRLQKMLEVMVALGFEYICILHAETHIYELYAN